MDSEHKASNPEELPYAQKQPFGSSGESDGEDNAAPDSHPAEKLRFLVILTHDSSQEEEKPMRPFVEERLQKYSTIYQEKRKEGARREEERTKPQKPRIDSVSEKIVAKMNVLCESQNWVISE